MSNIDIQNIERSLLICEAFEEVLVSMDDIKLNKFIESSKFIDKTPYLLEIRRKLIDEIIKYKQLINALNTKK